MTNIYKTNKDFTVSEKDQLMKQFATSGLDYQEFAKEHNINQQTMKNWAWWSRRSQESIKKYSPAERKKILEAFGSSGMNKGKFCKAWGLSATTLTEWERRYEKYGADGLMPLKKNDDLRFGSKIPKAVHDEIISVKKSKPEFGVKKIRQWLLRFRGVKVSTGSIRKTVVSEGLPLAKKNKKKKKSSDRIRRFERAKPMQLWQSDITQFTLGQYWSRVYLTVFMDDHSRYIVAWRLQSRQTADLVMDAFKDGINQYGKPQEVLTDQGRQYFAWRGKSELEKVLEKEGIKHVVSRAHHPQTLGKCERFWETVGNEFWSRIKPQELEEARVRLKYFIDHYNFQRPHQGLDGQVPADRFFGVAEEVRLAIEKRVAENALNLALGELPKPPAFLIGQVGGQRIAFHGTSGQFYLSTDQEDLSKQELEGRALDTQDVFNMGVSDGNKEESNDQRREVPSNTNSGALDEGHGGGEAKSQGEGTNNNGIFNGADDESASHGEIGVKTHSLLAGGESVPAWHECRVIDSAPAAQGTLNG